MKKVLVISPHMDDEVLGVGDTICRYVKEKCCIKVCFVCNRAYNHKYEEMLIQQEKRYALNAKKVLRYQEHVFLDCDDERLDRSLIDVIIPIEKIIREFKPNIVFIPHKGDNNQDHRVVFEASMVALRSFSVPYVEEVYSYEVLSSTEQAAPFEEYAFLPNVYVNIKDFIKRKKSALGCYQREKRKFPHPRSIKSLELLAGKRGVEAHIECAEAFKLVRFIRR